MALISPESVLRRWQIAALGEDVGELRPDGIDGEMHAAGGQIDEAEGFLMGIDQHETVGAVIAEEILDADAAEQRRTFALGQRFIVGEMGYLGAIGAVSDQKKARIAGDGKQIAGTCLTMKAGQAWVSPTCRSSASSTLMPTGRLEGSSGCGSVMSV